jgi:rubrerythrin
MLFFLQSQHKGASFILEGNTMPYGQAKEILEYAREFHRQVGSFYQQLADKAQSERVKLLLDYMIRHEKHLERALEDYEQSITTKALNSWYQYTKDQRTFTPLDSLAYSEQMSVEDVIKIGTTIDNCLITSYKGVADTTTSDEVREIFQNLLDMEEQEKHVKARVALGINDL